MNSAKLKTLLKDPVLMTTLCCMVASTLISFFLVSKHHYSIDILESEIRDKKVLVRDTSNNVNQKRIQVDAVILLNSVMDNSDKNARVLKAKYLQIFPDLNADSTSIEILEAFETYRNEKFDDINDAYIEQITLEEEKDHLERKNTLYASIATLLQVLGLALIIVRKDLSIDSLY